MLLLPRVPSVRTGVFFMHAGGVNCHECGERTIGFDLMIGFPFGVFSWLQAFFACACRLSLMIRKELVQMHQHGSCNYQIAGR